MGNGLANIAVKHSFFKKIGFSLMLSAALALSAVAPGAALAEQNAAQAGETDNTIALQLLQVFQTIQQNHISGVSERELADIAIKAMIESLNDPYTTYMSKEEFESFFQSIEQQVVGIGIRVGQDDGGFYVAEVLDNTPAAAGGILPDDYIEAVNGNSVDGMNLDQLVSAITGKEGTSVTVTVRRGDRSLDLAFVRKAFSVSAAQSKLLDGNVGYISLSGFSDEGAKSFAARLADLKANGMKALIVDLRGNPGGTVQSALDIAKQFIKEGTLMLMRDKNGKTQTVPINGGSTVQVPVTVLVNETTASAAEVLSGALQDYKAATLIGTKTFGKGSVQNVYSLAGGAGLKVTSEEYMTPKGRKVNQVGITPDITVEGDVPQLIAALRQSGQSDFTLRIQKHAIELNGARFINVVPVVAEEDEVFVPTRILAALIGAEAQWNIESQSVELRAGDRTETFAVAEGEARNDSGTSLIALSWMSAKFPQLSWTNANGQIEIRVTKGN